MNDNESRGGYPVTFFDKIKDLGKVKIIFTIMMVCVTVLLVVTTNDNNKDTNSYHLKKVQSKISIDLIEVINECSVDDDCCVVGDTCPTCTASTVEPSQQRTRRNLLSLAYDEWKKVVDAYWKMKLTSTEEGQSQYGPFFKNYDYFVVKHYAATQDLRGDQAHFSSAFMTYHSLFELEFEKSLLSIDPSIEALPYWNWNDTVAEKSIFTAEFFGSVPGTGENGQVIDGLFANWTISKFNEQFFADNYKKYLTNIQNNGLHGYSESGYLRNNPTANSILTRYGYNSAVHVDKNCAKPTTFPWFQWYACIEERSHPSYHGTPHTFTGGSIINEDGNEFQGDFLDCCTSPNEPPFHLHHPNLDRNKMKWMELHSAAAEQYYGYPVTSYAHIISPGNVDYTNTIEGVGLMDKVSETWGFYDADLGINAHRQPDTPEGEYDRTVLWTHADALCYLQPHTAPYKYDTLE